MKKLPVIALMSLLALGLGAGFSPASAATIASCQDDVQQSYSTSGSGTYSSEIDAQSASIIAGLRDKGLNVQGISDWGGCVKADVVRANGRVAQEFFDPTTLQRLSVNG